MLLRVIAVLGVALLLTGCLTAQERDQEACGNYGFTPGTDGFANCMLQLHGQHQAAALSILQMNQANQQLQTQRQMQMIQQSRPVYTTCNRFGYSVNCTSY